MDSPKIIQLFSEAQNNRNTEITFFFLENVLRARADLHMESGLHEHDQEINVYLAGLLNSLIDTDTFSKPYISPFDRQVREYLEYHPGLRNQYTVYRDNADFGLILLGFFFGFEHQGSYHHIVLSDIDEKGRIALYYEQAASALSHLKGGNVSLVTVFQELAEYLPEILRILRHVGSAYFDFVEKLSQGGLYHLENEMNRNDEGKLYNVILDNFLKKYETYKENPLPELKNEVLRLADELKKLNKNFMFDKFESDS